MKKTVTTLLAILLVTVTALSLVACGNKEPEKTTSVSAYKSTGEYTELPQHLSWEDINKFPIKSADMSTDEMRQLCVDFFRYCKTALWIPDDNWDFQHFSDNSMPDTLEKGAVYGGIPYISLSCGNSYRILDYMDPETGVVDIKNAGAFPNLFGNQCALGAYQGWSRVANSAEYIGSHSMVVSKGFYRVGEYTYDDSLARFNEKYDTKDVVNKNGAEIMYNAYAELKKGDGLVRYIKTSGHVGMVSEDAHVERNADGSVNPTKSYVMLIDQGQTWQEAMTEDGLKYEHQARVDVKQSFAKLFQQVYLPYTFGELLGIDPVEETEVTYSFSGESMTKDDLYGSKVTANYHICDIYAVIKDKKGNEVFKTATRAVRGSTYEMVFSNIPTNSDKWGSLDTLSPKEKYTVEIIAQLGTGERPTLYTGKFIAE